MQQHVLTPGTVLDGRYRIDALLGEGGYGITYAATQLSMDNRVAVKELFWRNHSARDCQASPEVAISRSEDAVEFNRQKEKFLQEARTLLKFRDLSGVVHVLDYFEANNTAYIVMEYVEGETLRQALERNGRFRAEDLFRRFLPLVSSLNRIHESRVIHRDISPDNIMVLADGSLKLIDFGAARMLQGGEGGAYSAIVKESFAPAEQYDKNGRQGPWTDVYALCATMYACLTGTPPLSAVQRMFLDELEAPSRKGVEIDPRFEAVVMKGLRMKAAERYQSAEELAQAMLEALPQEKPKGSFRKRAIPILIACAVCVAAVCAVFTWPKPDPFGGAPTEIFRLDAPDDMSASDFASAKGELTRFLEGFASDGKYAIETEGTRYTAEVPLDSFGGTEIGVTLRDAFKASEQLGCFELQYDPAVVWEDPAATMFAGKNQVAGDAFRTPTVLFCYKLNPYENEPKAREWEICLFDMKSQLDTFEMPYALGSLYGDGQTVAVRIGPEKIGRFVAESLSCGSIELRGETNAESYVYLGRDSVFNAVEFDDGTVGLQLIPGRDYIREDLAELTERIQSHGWDTLYLQTGNVPVARLKLDAPLAEDILTFRDFMFEGMETLDASRRFVADFFVNLVDAGSDVLLTMTDIVILDAQGKTIPDADPEDYFGYKALRKPQEAALSDAIDRIHAETGYVIGEDEYQFAIRLGLNADDNFVENVKAVVPILLKEYGLGGIYTDKGVTIYLTDAQDEMKCYCCVLLNTIGSDGNLRTRIALALNVSVRKHKDALWDWWDSLNPEDCGVDEIDRSRTWVCYEEEDS